MRRSQLLLLVGAVAVTATACDSKKLVTETGFQPMAGVRFINAVPDSAGVFGMDMRFVDLLESNAHFRIAFRNNISSSQPFTSSQIQYKGALAGSRHFRVFLNDTVQAVASTVMADQTQNLVEGHNYTGIMWGYGRSTGSDAMRFDFWDEDLSSKPTLTGTSPTQVGIRIINATNQAIDARIYRGSTASVPLANAATVVTVPALSKTDWMLDTAGAYMLNVRLQGQATNFVATDTRSLPGSMAICSGATITTTRACVAPPTRSWAPESNYVAGDLVRGGPGASAADTVSYIANVANGPATAVGAKDPKVAANAATWTLQPAADIEAQPGTLVRGSAVTAIVFPTVTAAVPAPAASAATLAAAAGNLEPGTYRYRVTFVTASGETQGGANSNAIVVANSATAGQVNLTGIPLGPAVPSTTSGPVGAPVIARRIYRISQLQGQPAAEGSYLVGTLNDNTTTVFTDNSSTASVRTAKQVPASNTTIRTPQGASFQAPAVSWMWDKRPPRGCLPAYCGQ